MPLQQLIDDNLAMLDQATELVESLPSAARGTGFVQNLGPHLRHVLDHYDSFIRGVEAGTVDYDHRDRCQQTELSPSFAARRLRATRAKLSGLSDDLLAQGGGQPLRVRLSTHAERASAETESTAARELQFLQSHCVHHFALMRRILGELGVKLSDEFGKAPATVSFERASAQVS